MTVSCDVIKDLLPLYAEDMVSSDSRKLVDEHLAECASCRSRLEDIQWVQKVPAVALDAELASIQRVEKGIRKRRWTAVIFAALLALTVSFGLYLFLNQRQYVALEDAVVEVTETEDRVEVKFSNDIANINAVRNPWSDSEGETVFLIGYNTRWDIITNANRGREGYTFSSPKEDLARIFYEGVPAGASNSVIWGASSDAILVSLPRLAMHYYFLIAVVCGVVLLIPAVILRRKKAGAVLGVGSAFFWCYALCSFLVAEGDWRVYDDVNFTVHFLFNILLAVLFWLTLLVGSKLWKISRRDLIS